PDIHEVLPTPPNDPSPYRKLLALRVVLDTWGGQFKDHADWLRELASYHLTHLATIVHDWQHGGYDNELPSVLPANPKLGGDAGMTDWVHTATGLGEIIGLHENYVDFYPNSAVYDENDVAHDSAGHLVPAWKNLIQSYAMAPTAILKYARMFAPAVHDRFGANGAFLDVHSSVPPWFHVDFRSGTPGAGKFSTVLNAHRDLWKLFRQVHGGPVFGEGSNHWYWSGMLDGVEAQFGVGVPSNGGETAPLFPDFDLLKIHPLQFNHGMGYLERWGADRTYKNWVGAIPPMKTLDQYRMQELVYGHAGFIASPLVRNLAFIWQEHNLVLPVTSQYATAQPRSIEYEVDGKMMDASEAIAAHGAFDRVHIQYDNGLSLWANGRADDWTLHTAGFSGVLPQFGWHAEGGGSTAYTLLRDGVVVDYAETPTTLFANARTTIPEGQHPVDVEPSILHWEQTGPRRFRVTFGWDVRQAIPPGESAFLHVTGQGTEQGESILFQPSFGIATAPGDWPVGKVTEGQPVDVTLPDTVRDGAIELKAGLYSQVTGDRMFLKGLDDGSRRIILGRLIVSDGGKTLRLEKESLSPEVVRLKEAERAAHTNPTRKRINFGKVETDGSILLERERAGSWLLTPFPRTEPFTVVIRTTLLDPSLKNVRIEALGPDGHALPQPVAVQAEGPASSFQVNTIPGAVRYRVVSNTH
ncbi:MAG: DUF5696 domain-containing protein, partial [Armatimonadota bacterium]|nr:DUF5696 domain-containing protein [Armatimonadota bacterium]